jgi:stalled ribosome rescue protein Dom34
MSSKNFKRGYPVAVLIALERNQAVLWKIFSDAAKQETIISIDDGKADNKALYSFFESIVNALRPTLKEGVKSIIIASPPRSGYEINLLSHMRAHHSWLIQGTNKASISTINGQATTPTQIATLTSTSAFKALISETTTQETDNIMEILEKRLNTSNNLVLFSLEDSEKAIFSNLPNEKEKPEYLLVTDNYLNDNRQKRRLQRLLQIAANKEVKTRVVNAESPAGIRLNQLGGIVCLSKISQ